MPAPAARRALAPRTLQYLAHMRHGLRVLLIVLLGAGPLTLLQGIAWAGMALQTDLSQVASGSELLSALHEELATPCQLCRSVQDTQEQQDAAPTTERRLELALFRPDPVLLSATVPARHDWLTPYQGQRSQTALAPELPPPRA